VNGWRTNGRAGSLKTKGSIIRVMEKKKPEIKIQIYVKRKMVNDAVMRSDMRNGHLLIEEEGANDERKTKRSSKILRSNSSEDSVI